MADLSFSFDPAEIAANSDAASSALAEANAASSVAAELEFNLTDLDATPNSDHSANGPQCNDIAAGETIAVMDCVYLKSDGEWWKTDADAVATAKYLLGISLEAKNDGQIMNVAFPGCFVRDDSWTWTVGGEIYLDTATAGGLTQTAPSGTDDVVRIVGHATHANRMFFYPDQTIIVHN